jgi:DNA-binding MarR family transcriptional regulator
MLQARHMESDLVKDFLRREELLEETLGMIRRFRVRSFGVGRSLGRGPGLPAVHHSALHFAIRRPGAIQQDLARYLGIQRSHVSEVVKSLERRGLIRRVPDDSDRRLNHLEITPLGNMTHERFHEAHGETVPAFFRGWTEEEIEILHLLFRRLELRGAQPPTEDLRVLQARSNSGGPLLTLASRRDTASPGTGTRR